MTPQPPPTTEALIQFCDDGKAFALERAENALWMARLHENKEREREEQRYAHFQREAEMFAALKARLEHFAVQHANGHNFDAFGICQICLEPESSDAAKVKCAGTGWESVTP